MCVHDCWISSDALSRSTVSKSWPKPVCVLITPYSRLNLLHFLQCAINIHMAEPTHCDGLIACLKMSPRCSIENRKIGDVGDSVCVCVYINVSVKTCEIYHSGFEIAFSCYLVKT